MVRFFKKSVPDNPVSLSTGQSIRFGTVDGQTGYYRTDNEGIQRELVGFIEAMRYGLSECAEAEYRAYQEQKKNSVPNRLNRPWREEVSPGSIASDTSSRTPAPTSNPVPAAVVSDKTDIPPVPVPPAVPQPEYVPNLGRRVKASE